MARVLSISIIFYLITTLFCCESPKTPSGAPDTDTESQANWGEVGEFEQKLSAYEDENRDLWQKPDRVIDLMGPLEGKTVVDLGAGSGYFAFRLLPKAGRVIAVDIDPQFVRFLEDKRSLLPSEQQEKFEARMAKPDDPMLKDGEADAILLVSTYVYIDDRVDYFNRLKSKLAEGGKIVIIEFKKKSIPNGPPDDEKISLSQVEDELKEAGYRNIVTDDRTLDYQYIVTARVE